MLYPTELRARGPTISGDDPRGTDRRLGRIGRRHVGRLDAARVNGLAQRLERGRRMAFARAVGGRGSRGIGILRRPTQTAVTAHQPGTTATGGPRAPARSDAHLAAGARRQGRNFLRKSALFARGSTLRAPVYSGSPPRLPAPPTPPGDPSLAVSKTPSPTPAILS